MTSKVAFSPIALNLTLLSSASISSVPRRQSAIEKNVRQESVGIVLCFTVMNTDSPPPCVRFPRSRFGLGLLRDVKSMRRAQRERPLRWRQKPTRSVSEGSITTNRLNPRYRTVPPLWGFVFERSVNRGLTTLAKPMSALRAFSVACHCKPRCATLGASARPGHSHVEQGLS
jgi:hypothetical protein